MSGVIDRKMPVLSIIMPVYNEAEYIAFALESVLMQETDFPYEIIVVDDCSTDDTAVIIQKYQEIYSHIVYVRNPENKGNAYSFWSGLTHSRGEFFHVLDGDDFFLLHDKLQRQVDFLHANPDFVAVATNSLRLFPDRRFHPEVPPGKGEREYFYADVLRCDFYFHTSAYMYRNIFRGNIPAYLQEEWARGDTIRTILIAKYGKVKFLDIIASVYRFNNRGIWTSMTHRQRNQRTVRVFTTLSERVLDAPEEKAIFAETIRAWKDLTEKSGLERWLSLCGTPSRLIAKIRKMDIYTRLRGILFPNSLTVSGATVLNGLSSPRKMLFRPWYLRPKANALCETIGRLYIDGKQYLSQTSGYDDQQVIILAEAPDNMAVETIMKRHSSCKLTLIGSGLSRKMPLEYLEIPQSYSPYEKMTWIIDTIVARKPAWLYVMASDDMAIRAAIQHGTARKILYDT